MPRILLLSLVLVLAGLLTACGGDTAPTQTPVVIVVTATSVPPTPAPTLPPVTPTPVPPTPLDMAHLSFEDAQATYQAIANGANTPSGALTATAFASVPHVPTPTALPAIVDDGRFSPPKGVFTAASGDYELGARITDYPTHIGSKYATTGKRFILVLALLNNAGSGDISANPINFSLQLANGTVAPIDDSTFSFESAFPAVTVPGGGNATGNVSFYVATRIAPHYLYYRAPDGTRLQIDFTGTPSQP